MKRYTCFLLTSIILSVALFTSCKKDPPLAEAIIGKWEVQSYKYVIYQNSVMKQEVSFYLEPGEMAIQFAEEGVGIMYENNEMAGNFNWSLSGTNVTLTFANGPVTWSINIDDDILVWSYTESETEGSISFDYEFFYTAKKNVK